MAVAGFGTGMVEAQAFTRRQISVPVLPENWPTIKVLQLSDLHLLPGQNRKLRFLKTLSQLEPDLVVCTGDLLAADRALPDLLQALDPLFKLPGVFVFGSNDYFAAKFRNPFSYLTGTSKAQHGLRELNWRQLRRAMMNSGWQDLTHATTKINLRGKQIEFRGTDDAHIDAADYSLVAGACQEEFTIGVTHAPYQRVLTPMVADGIPLILAGHTHGGQVCLPVNRALVTNCDLPRKMASGLHKYRTEQGSAWLHVSAGLGTSPFAPYRLFCRPEVTLLQLEAINSPESADLS